ncbi:GntR family transcriptional regulator [Dactylosporangium siamense]|uniref:HTH-type transcriptional repressor DasR n=1 Tax=Dactylosporangium siamense TaxID=685454 RepID=A0A919PXF1_9ACTN|nr:GntR family transcriptional regulator [Dactylosporangium siamense]GIG50135.1 HTH-type transcriptional repressor DasR [Dactylosporangium siamense]
MKPTRLDPSSYVPLYMQLAALLREQIQQGRYQSGDQLPSEPTLVREFEVSRATAIAALDELVASHEAYRVRGRGTFVAKPFLGRFSLSTSFTEDMRQRGLEPSSEVLEFGVATPDPETAAMLGAPLQEECYRVVRLRLANGDPVALQTAYLPRRLYPDLTAEHFADSHLYDVMRRVYSIVPQWAEAIVQAHKPTAQEARHLDMATRDPVLVAWHLSLDDSLRSLEYVRSVYRSDRFSFASGRQSVIPPNAG